MVRKLPNNWLARKHRPWRRQRTATQVTHCTEHLLLGSPCFSMQTHFLGCKWRINCYSSLDYSPNPSWECLDSFSVCTNCLCRAKREGSLWCTQHRPAKRQLTHSPEKWCRTRDALPQVQAGQISSLALLQYLHQMWTPSSLSFPCYWEKSTGVKMCLLTSTASDKETQYLPSTTSSYHFGVGCWPTSGKDRKKREGKALSFI